MDMYIVFLRRGFITLKFIYDLSIAVVLSDRIVLPARFV